MENDILLWTNIGFILFIFSLLVNTFNTYRNLKTYEVIGNTIDNFPIFLLTNVPIVIMIFTDGFLIAVISYFLVWVISHILLQFMYT
jgi:hypothetical protein